MDIPDKNGKSNFYIVYGMPLITKCKANFISLTQYLSSLVISVGQNKPVPYNTTIDQNGGEIIFPFSGKLEHLRFYYHVSCNSRISVAYTHPPLREGMGSSMDDHSLLPHIKKLGMICIAFQNIYKISLGVLITKNFEV